MATGGYPNIPNRRAQGSPEFMMVISFVFLVFIVVLFLSLQKQNEAFLLQRSWDAQRVVGRVADNINSISKNGNGYYKYFSIPYTLYGMTDYDINLSGNFLEISYDDESQGAHLVTENVSILHLERGEYKRNCVKNENGEIVVNDICGLSDGGCGSVIICDPGDMDTCASCDSPMPRAINQNSRSTCASYGCSTDEWHLYRLVPNRSGTLSVTFSGNGTMTGSDQTDLTFYDYNTTGCASPQHIFQIEPLTTVDYPVVSGRTYIIGLDVDSQNCSFGGSYTLTTGLA